MISKRKLLLLFVFIILATPFFGQEFSIDRFSRFVNYNVQSGLCHNAVNDIIQDPKGFIWFATEHGLSRYDGYSFLNFFHNPDDPNSLPGNSVLTLEIDDQGFLWIGTTEGLCRLDLNNGKFDRFFSELGNPNSPRANHIRKLYLSAPARTLWIETLGGTLSMLNLKTSQWEHFSHETSYQPYYRYHTIFEDSQGSLWVGGRSTSIFKFDLERKSFHRIPAIGEELGGKRDNDLADIIETSSGHWFVMGLDGIYEFSPNTEKFKKIHTSSTFSVTEDSLGYVWFGSGNGLLRYCSESKSFIAYRNNKNNPSSIIHNHINKVYIDKVGNVWVGTRNGASLLSQKSKLFDHYYHIPGDNNSLSANEVTALAQGNDGTVYIGTAYNGLNIWKSGESGFNQISSDLQEKCSLSANRISSLYFDSNDMLWVGLWAGVGFNKYNPKTECFTRYAYDKTSFKYDWYNAFLEDSRNNFLVGMWGGYGANYFDRNREEFTNKHFIEFNKPYNRPITDLMFDGSGNYFLLTFYSDRVIYKYNSETDRYTSHSYSNDPPTVPKPRTFTKTNIPFPFNEMNKMASNGKGFSVFATDKGLFSYEKESGFESFYQKDLNPIDVSILDDLVYLLDKNRIFVFKLDGTKLIEHNFPGDRFKKIIPHCNQQFFLVGDGKIYYSRFDSNISSQEFTLIEIPEISNISYATSFDNYLWLCSTHGLFRLNINDFESKNPIEMMLDIPVTFLLSHDNDEIVAFSPLGIYRINLFTHKKNLVNLERIPENFTTAVNTAVRISNELIWIGIQTGHYQINLSTGEIIDTNLPENNRVSSHLVTTLIEDSTGNLWIGTSNMGLNRIDLHTRYVKHFYAPELPSNVINSTIQSSDGKIWVATDKGLCFIKEDFVVKVTNIPSNLDIKSLVEDDSGLIWAGTNNGILAIDPSTTHFEHFNEVQGFPSSDFSKAVLRLNNGSLAFGTSKGFVVFNPSVILQQRDYSNDISFTHFNVFNKTREFFFNVSDTLLLDYKENFFEIKFTAADYGFTAGTFFSYKLLNVDPSWVHSQSNSASYTNVPPGNYLFQVSKILADGQPSVNYSTLFIRIKPAFWQTFWFRFSIILFVLGGFSAYMFTYVRQLNAARRNTELEQKLLISQMNPHFIFNSLSAIQSFMYCNQPEEAGNYLSSFSRLVRLILENSRSQFISIRQEVQTLELYLSLQKLRFPNKFDYFIEVDPKLINSGYSIPPMLAQPFIENSIEHGIIHKEGKGDILVELKIDDNLLCIIVEDNGIGIEKSKKIKIQNRISHTSYATSITRERIKNIISKRKVGTGVQIIDLYSQGLEGTRVEIRLPYNFKNNENYVN